MGTLDFFNNVVHEIVSNENYQRMKKYQHHANVSCYEHCYNVALYSYILAIRNKWNVDLRALIRGAMLHDYYLYDWHVRNGRKRWHGFRHPKISYNNAKKDFEINKKEKDIIIKHMWPLTLFSIPRYRESFIVTYADKMITIKERYLVLKRKNA